MADSGSEARLKALFDALESAAPAGAKVVRNETLPSRIPPGGWICLRDGDPGPYEFLFCPPTYIYEHVAEVDVLVDLPTVAARDARFDQLKQAIGAATAADRTLGGLCDYVLGEAPAPVELPMDGSETLKAATIGIVLTYGLSDPLL